MSKLYDNPEFFAKYSDLRLNDTGINGSLEVPALRAQIGNVSGKKILDIGCGHGLQLNWFFAQGAAKICGIDPSANMIDFAQKNCVDSSIEIIQGYFEEQNFEEAFDLITSSMALHYVEDVDLFFKKCFSALIPGGALVFSCEHPICTAFPQGLIVPETGLAWAVMDYAEEGEREQHWFVDGVKKYHRKVSTLVNHLIQNGFKIEALEEPTPVDRIYSSEEKKAKIHWVRPPIILIRASK